MEWNTDMSPAPRDGFRQETPEMPAEVPVAWLEIPDHPLIAALRERSKQEPSY